MKRRNYFPAINCMVDAPHLLRTVYRTADDIADGDQIPLPIKQTEKTLYAFVMISPSR